MKADPWLCFLTSSAVEVSQRQRLSRLRDEDGADFGVATGQRPLGRGALPAIGALGSPPWSPKRERRSGLFSERGRAPSTWGRIQRGGGPLPLNRHRLVRQEVVQRKDPQRATPVSRR